MFHALPFTPGTSRSAKAAMLRPPPKFSGRSEKTLEVTLSEFCAVSVASIAASAVTTTLSVMPPTSHVGSTRAMVPASSVMFSFTNSLNPAAWKRRR